MKVLFVCPFVPWPPDDGGRIRTSNLVRELSERCELELFVIAPPDGIPRDAVRELAEHVAGGRVRAFERSRATPRQRLLAPKLERWFESAALRAAAAERVRAGAVDLVHLDELLLARLLPADAVTPGVLHHHKLDVEFAAATAADPGRSPRRRLEARLDLLKLRALERAAARRHPYQITCSADDARSLQARHPDLRLAAVPSGYDPEFFAPREDTARDPDSLLYLGHMGYAPNVDAVRWFCADVLPLVRTARPTARLRIVGREPAPEVRALAGEGVEVVGEVEDVRPYLTAAAALVVPLRIGGGTRLKIVESLAMATPTVSTRIGAQGLDLREGRDLRLADAPAEFAAAVLELLADPAAAARLGRAGRATVSERYRWEALAGLVLEHWERARAGTKPG